MADLPTTDDTDRPAGNGLSRWAPVVVAFAAALALLGFIAATSSSDGDDDQTTIGDFTFQTADGGAFTLADLEGTPLVVNYFAAWCPPCRAELPDFEAVHQETKDDVTFVGVSRDNVTDSWKSLIAETGVTYTTVFEGNVQGSFAFLEATAMPTTVFVGADGTIEHIWTGALTDDKLRELIAEHLT
jgi:peroxiredoxin